MVEIVAVLNSRPPVEAISDVHSQVAISLSNILTTNPMFWFLTKNAWKTQFVLQQEVAGIANHQYVLVKMVKRVPGTATNQSQVEGCIKKLSDWKCNFITR